MGKKGNNNPLQKNNKRMKNNYFTNMIQRYGENFLENMDQRELQNTLQRDPARIFREMMGGNIDMYKYANYFAHPIFLNALINNSYMNYMKAECEFNAFQYYIAVNANNGIRVDDMYVKFREEWRIRRDIYSLINVSLNTFAVDPNPGHLVALCSALGKYGNQGRYLILN